MTPHERLIEIVTREVGVKESGGDNRGPRVEEYQKAVDNLARGESWCYPGYMEILTDGGWLRLDQLAEFTGRVAQVDDSGVVSFTKNWTPIKKDYKGTGYSVNTRSMNFRVDKGHRFWGYFNNAEVPSFGTLADVSTLLCIPGVVSGAPGIGLTERELGLLAALCAGGFFDTTSGARPRIRVQVSKSREVEACEALNPVSRYAAKHTCGESEDVNTFDYEVPASFSGLFSTGKALRWETVFSFSASDARLFLSWFERFAGNRSKSGSVRLFASDELLRDQLITLAVLAGYHPSVTPLSDRVGYIISYSLTKKTRTIRKQHIMECELNEPLFCVTVPESRIIVRDTYFNAFLTGNCMAFVQWAIKQVEAEFGIKSPLFKSEHCLTVWNKTPVENRLKEPIPGAVMIWRHGNTINGHTGIVTKVTANNVYTVEGNTSDGKGVNRNGDGVYARVRSRVGSGAMKVVGWIDPFPK